MRKVEESRKITIEFTQKELDAIVGVLENLENCAGGCPLQPSEKICLIIKGLTVHLRNYLSADDTFYDTQVPGSLRPVANI